MSLSTEAIISIIGVLTNLPPALLILWKLYKWKWAPKRDTLGMCAAHQVSNMRRPDLLQWKRCLSQYERKDVPSANFITIQLSLPWSSSLEGNELDLEYKPTGREFHHALSYDSVTKD